MQRFLGIRSRTLFAIRSVLFTAAVFSLAGCAGREYLAADPDNASFIDRAVTQSDGPVRITAAVPDASETESLIGLPLYNQGIQPVWLKVENRGSTPVRVALWSIDSDYYSPLEVAWMNRKGFSKEGKRDMERWFFTHAMQRRIPPGAVRSGLVYTHLDPGTKGFNVDVITTDEAFDFTFFVPMPGFTADYMEVDLEALYDSSEIQNTMTLSEVRPAVAAFPCCSTDKSGAGSGEPFNVIIVSSGPSLRRALLRAGWNETEAGGESTAAAREQRFRGRRPDGTFEKSRADGSERKELRLWLSPALVEGERVWIGQASQELNSGRGVEQGYRIDADIDQARDYVLQNFWYSQSLKRAGITRGFEPVDRATPRTTFSGTSYFTDGQRAVLWIAEHPVGIDEAEMLLWERLTSD